MRWGAILLIALVALPVSADRRRLMLAQRPPPAAGGGYDPDTNADLFTRYKVHGTVGTNASNSAITNLVDLEGGTPFTNLTALAGGPIISNNFLNGKSVMFGFGTNYLLSAAGDYVLESEAHLFILLKAKTDDGSTYDGFARWWGSDGQQNFYPFGTDIYSSFASSTRHNGNPSADISQWHLLEIVSKSGSWKLRINGTDEITDAVNTVAFDFSNPIAIMTGSIPGSTGWQGAIAEIMVFNAEQTGGTLTDIRGYFTSEYGVP